MCIRDRFRIYLVNFWLKLLTLGFYHPWAKARLFRYLYASTRLYDTDFQFHGNGRELFTGWVKALLALILLEGFHQVLAELIRQRGIDSEPGVGGGHEWYFWLDTANLVFYLLLFFLFFMIMSAHLATSARLVMLNSVTIYFFASGERLSSAIYPITLWLWGPQAKTNP